MCFLAGRSRDILQLISIDQQIIQNWGGNGGHLVFATDIIQFFMGSKCRNERIKCMGLSHFFANT